MNSQTTEDRFLLFHVDQIADLQTDDIKYQVRLTPDDWVESKSGTFIVDEEAAGLVIDEFNSHGVMRPIDWEHQGLGGEYSSPDGKAPAAGWITKIHYEKGKGLIGDVWWTDEAREAIRAKKYLYISPVTVVRKTDLRVIELISAALTNTPAIPRMEALAAKYSPQNQEANTMPEPTGGGATTPTGDGGTTAAGPSPDMLVAEIKAYLGITVDANARMIDVLKAIRDWAEKNKGKAEGEGEGEEEKEGGGEAVASKALCETLGVKADASESELLVAANTLAKGNESSVAANKRIAAMEEELGTIRAKELMEPHIARGAINPNNAVDWEHCKQIAMKTPDKFEPLMGSRPDGSMAPPPGRTTAPPRGAAGNSREKVIANSSREYGENPRKAITDLVTFVNGALREDGMARLTDDEKTKLVAV